MDVNRSIFYLTGGPQILKATAGRIRKLAVLASSLTTSVGALYDCNTTVSFGPQNQFAIIPTTPGNYDIDWAFNQALGASVAPGQTIAISFE